MRFSYFLMAGAALVLPWQAPAQDAAPAGETEQQAEEGAPAAEPEPFAQDGACATELSPELEASFGEPVAWPTDGQTVHTPAGLTVLGKPVGYVLVKRGGAGGRIDEIAYRLQGMERQVGQPHDAQLLRAFDDEFESADCADSKESTCGVVYRTNGGNFTGAQIGNGEIDLDSDARGPSLGLVEADWDLLDSDPVFLVCFYRGS